MTIIDALIAKEHANDEKWQYKHLTDPNFRQRLRDDIIALLKIKYGGLDYWRLSKDWKELHHTQVAHILLADIDIIIGMILDEGKSTSPTDTLTANVSENSPNPGR